MFPLSRISLEAWSSILGIVVTALLGYRILKQYYTYHTELSKYFGWFFLLTAISFACVGWLEFASPTYDQARWSYLLSAAFFYISLLPQVRVLWFVSGATNKLFYRLIMIGVTVLSLLCWYLEFLQVTFDVSKHPIGITFSQTVLYILSGIYVLLMYPAGYFFIRQGLRQSSLKSRFKSMSIGAGYIVVTSVGTYNNIFHKGQSDIISIYLYVITAILMLVALLLPTKSDA